MNQIESYKSFAADKIAKQGVKSSSFFHGGKKAFPFLFFSYLFFLRVRFLLFIATNKSRRYYISNEIRQ